MTITILLADLQLNHTCKYSLIELRRFQAFLQFLLLHHVSFSSGMHRSECNIHRDRVNTLSRRIAIYI